MWISGHHKPVKSDITMFCGGDADAAVEDRDHSALYFQLKEGAKLVGDSGYAGEPSKLVIAKEEHSSEFKHFLARAKKPNKRLFTQGSRVSTFLAVASATEKNTEERICLHEMNVFAVAGIIQTNYKIGHPSVDVV